MNTRRLNWKDYLLELIIGAFFISALSIIGYYTVLLSNGKIAEDTTRVEIRFPRIDSLKKGDSVLLRGMVIGKVQELELDDNYVAVYCDIRDKVNIYSGCEIHIKSSSMLGGNQLEIIQGDTSLNRLDLSQPLYGTPSFDVLAEAGKMLQKLQKEEVLEKISAVADNLKVVTEKINTGDGTLAKLLNDDALFEEGRQAAIEVKKAGQSITAAGEKVTEIAASFDNVGLEAEKMIKALRADLDQAMADISTFTGKLNSDSSSINRLLSDDGGLYLELKEAFHSIRVLSDNIRNSEGTLGKLINDPTLYEDTQATVNEVKGTIQDFRENSSVSTFGSFIFGAL